MNYRLLFTSLLTSLAVACTQATDRAPASPESVSPEVSTGRVTEEVHPSETPAPAELPPVAGSEPSDRLAVFYYPWYRSIDHDGAWAHWQADQGQVFHPPQDISSDYYPVLGAYSSADPTVVAQQFSWLRQAGIGVIITSWWGQGTNEDRVVPLLLETGKRYGIKVAFHIEPYDGRTANTLLADVRYLCSQYGDYPAFYRTTATSRWSLDDQSKGLFFVWAIDHQDFNHAPVSADYWREAVDEIHNSDTGGIIIANSIDGSWVDGGHFDGLYNYSTPDLDASNGFTWAHGLPPDAWYVPSVIPGISGQRIRPGDEDFPLVERNEGDTFDKQWEAALGTYIEPAMVTITSFNEWHEGTQIEPAQAGATNGLGYSYRDYSPLAEDGYLSAVKSWLSRFQETSWSEAATQFVQIRLLTTSDWTNVEIGDNAALLYSTIVEGGDDPAQSGVEGNLLYLNQSLDEAVAGNQAELVIESRITRPKSGSLQLTIKRGNIGMTQIEFYGNPDETTTPTLTVQWGGVTDDGENSYTTTVAWEDLVAGQ